MCILKPRAIAHWFAKVLHIRVTYILFHHHGFLFRIFGVLHTRPHFTSWPDTENWQSKHERSKSIFLIIAPCFRSFMTSDLSVSGLDPSDGSWPLETVVSCSKHANGGRPRWLRWHVRERNFRYLTDAKLSILDQFCLRIVGHWGMCAAFVVRNLFVLSSPNILQVALLISAFALKLMNVQLIWYDFSSFALLNFPFYMLILWMKPFLSFFRFHFLKYWMLKNWPLFNSMMSSCHDSEESDKWTSALLSCVCGAILI